MTIALKPIFEVIAIGGKPIVKLEVKPNIKQEIKRCDIKKQ